MARVTVQRWFGLISLQQPLIRSLLTCSGLVLVLVGGAMLVSAVFAIVLGLSILVLGSGSWLVGLRRRRRLRASPPEVQQEAAKKAYEAIRVSNIAARIANPVLAVLIVGYGGLNVATALIVTGLAIMAILATLGPSEREFMAKLEKRRDGS